MDRPVVWYFCGLLLFLIFFAIQVPYCHDEWAWGSQSGLETLSTFFQGYNGRYLGDLLSLAVTRSVWAKVLILAFTIWGLILLMTVLIRKLPENRGTPLQIALLSTLLILGMPLSIFRQILGWVAAFVNFVPPVILFLIYWGLVRNIFSEPSPNYSRRLWIWMIPLGLCSQLFSEHNTIFHVLFAAFVLVYTYLRRHRVYAVHLSYFLSCLAGAAIMFLNPAYTNALRHTDGYKNIDLSAGAVPSLMKSGYSIINTLYSAGILPLLIAGLLLLLLVLSRRRSFHNQKRLRIAAGIGLTEFIVFFMVEQFFPKALTALSGFSHLLKVLLVCGSLFLFVACSLLTLWLCIPDTARRHRLMTIFLCAPALSLPLVVANPIGPRCFFASYLLLGVFFLELLFGAYSLSHIFSKPFTAILLAVTLALALYLGTIFLQIGTAWRRQISQIQQGVSQKAPVIQLEYLPHWRYIWLTAPPTDSWLIQFKAFYQIPDGVQVVFVDPS